MRYKNTYQKAKCGQRFVAVFLVMALALPVFNPSFAIASAEKNTFKDWRSLQLPEDIGSLEYRFDGRSNKKVILVQDAHSVSGAQLSLKNIIIFLQQEYGLNLVALEGASGEIDTQLFRAFPNQEKLEEAFLEFLAAGELSGAYAAAALGSRKIDFVGIEKQELYEQGIGYFLKALSNQPDYLSEIKSKKEIIREQKKKIYSAKLSAFDQKREAFENAEMDVIEWINYLAGFHQASKYPHLSAVLSEIKAAESKQPLDAKVLIQKFYREVKAGIKKQENQKILSSQYQAYQTEKISAAEFVFHIKKLIRNEKITGISTKELDRLTAHFALIEEMKADVVFDEMASFTADIEALLIQTPEEKKIHQESERLRLLDKLSRFEINRSEWQRLEQISGMILSSYSDFYRNAQQREEKMFENLLREMEIRKTEEAVLVCGGFHTQGIKEKLEKSQISYVVVTPYVEDVPNETRYLEFMRGEVSWKKYFEIKNGRIDLSQAFSRAAVDKLARNRALLKPWRDQIVRELYQQNRLLEAAKYTHFIDAVVSKKTSLSDGNLRKAWNIKVEKFIEGLKNLKSTDQLNAQNIIRLTQIKTATPWTAIPSGSVPAEWVGVRREGGRSELRFLPMSFAEKPFTAYSPEDPTWIEKTHPEAAAELNNRMVFSLQFEKGAHEGFYRKWGRPIARFLTQVMMTGGLGALMFDLAEAWRKNFRNIVMIHPLYNTWIKGKIPGLPRALEGRLGNFFRKEMKLRDDLSIQIHLNINHRFRTVFSKTRDPKILDKKIYTKVYFTETPLFKTPEYYVDAYYLQDESKGDIEENRVRIFDGVYPDDIWRVFQMAVYKQASSQLATQLSGNKKPAFIANEVYVSLPFPEHPDAFLMHINHTAVPAGMYEPPEEVYELLGFPEWMRPYIVYYNEQKKARVINIARYIALSYNVVSGVAIYEHDEVLRKLFFASAQDKLKTHNENGQRNTNGVLFEHWQAKEIRALIEQFRPRMEADGLAKNATDREIFDFLSIQKAMGDEFKRKLEVVKAKLVGDFLIWLEEVQRYDNSLWLTKTLEEFDRMRAEKGFDQSRSALEVLEDFRAKVAEAIRDESKWDPLFQHAENEQLLLEALLKHPIVSNVRRQVDYKGPDKWIEILEELERDPEALKQFRLTAGRILIGGRPFDDKADGNFNRIKELIRKLDLYHHFATIDDYNLVDAPDIFHAMAGVVLLSDEFLEASATSQEKGNANGAALLGVWGGANPELFDIRNERGESVDVFNPAINKETFHDELANRLDAEPASRWNIRNGWLVRYAQDEVSKEPGGGRRPSAKSLVAGLQWLRRNYQDRNDRRELLFNVLSASDRVNMETSQARAHTMMLVNGMRSEDENRKIVGSVSFSTDLAQRMFAGEVLGSFTYKVGPEEKVLETSGGILGLVDGFYRLHQKNRKVKIREKQQPVDVAEAAVSVGFHSSNQGKAGDIIDFIQAELTRIFPETNLITEKINALAESARAAKSFEDRVAFNLEAIRLMDRFIQKIAGELTEAYLAETEPEKIKTLEAYFQNPLIRKNVIRYLEGRPHTELIKTSEDGVKAFVITQGEEKFVVLVNLEPKTSPDPSDGIPKARARLEGAVSLGAIFGKEAIQDPFGSYQLFDQKRFDHSGRPMTYRIYPMFELTENGFPVGVPNIQILKPVKRKERLSAHLSAAFKNRRFKDLAPVQLLVEEFGRLSADEHQALIRDMSELVSMGPRSAGLLFGEKGVPVVMALVAIFVPEQFTKTRRWHEKAFGILGRIVDENRELFQTAAPRIHLTSRNTTLVLSKSIGERNVFTALQFFPEEHDRDDKKVRAHVRDLNQLTWDQTSGYVVKDVGLSSVLGKEVLYREDEPYSGADLLESNGHDHAFHVGVPTEDNAPVAEAAYFPAQLQILELVKAGRSELRFHQRRDDDWWTNPQRLNLAVSVPIGGLRFEQNDFGVGNYSDFERYAKGSIENGVKVFLLLPHFAISPAVESPFSPISVYALNEMNIDWSKVSEVSNHLERFESGWFQAKSAAVLDFADIRARQNKVAERAYEIFFSDSSRLYDERYVAFEKKYGQIWLHDYAEFRAIWEILGKPFRDMNGKGWTEDEIRAAKADATFQHRVGKHKYMQWIAYNQFAQTMHNIHQAGGRVLFDYPFFRGKDSVDVWRHSHYFRDLDKHPGVVDSYVNEHWRELALWNWDQLKREGFGFVLDPIRHWLEFGADLGLNAAFDGGRIDAFHFAFNFDGQLERNGSEPGLDYTASLANTFKEYGAMPLAEAFNGRDHEAAQSGIVTIDKNWARLNTHDDPRKKDATEFMAGFNHLFFNWHFSQRTARFIGFVLGDEWGDTQLLKVMGQENREMDQTVNVSYWRYRMPMPGDADYAERVRYNLQPLLSIAGADPYHYALHQGMANFISLNAQGKPALYAGGRNTHFDGQEWGRDFAISLLGIIAAAENDGELLLQNGFHKARNVARDLILLWAGVDDKGRKRIDGQSRDGQIMYNVINWYGSDNKNTADAPLWFVESVFQYVQKTGDAEILKKVVRDNQTLMDVLWEIINRYQMQPNDLYHAGMPVRSIQMDPETGFILVPHEKYTWMDTEFTPRQGYPVEIQALWYNALNQMVRLTERNQFPKDEKYRKAQALAEQVKINFETYFWNPDGEYLYDVLGTDGTMSVRASHRRGWADPAFRSNQELAVYFGLLEGEKAKQVVRKVEEKLLIPGALRSLADEPTRFGKYYHDFSDAEAGGKHKNAAYHSGLGWVWTYPLHYLTKVRLGLMPAEDARAKMQADLEPIIQHSPARSLPELLSGRAHEGVHARRGPDAQAWSVATALWALSELSRPRSELRLSPSRVMEILNENLPFAGSQEPMTKMRVASEPGPAVKRDPALLARAERFKKIRFALGIGQREFGQLIRPEKSPDPKTVGNWEDGVARIPEDAWAAAQSIYEERAPKRFLVLQLLLGMDVDVSESVTPSFETMDALLERYVREGNQLLRKYRDLAGISYDSHLAMLRQTYPSLSEGGYNKWTGEQRVPFQAMVKAHEAYQKTSPKYLRELLSILKEIRVPLNGRAEIIDPELGAKLQPGNPVSNDQILNWLNGESVIPFSVIEKVFALYRAYTGPRISEILEYLNLSDNELGVLIGVPWSTIDAGKRGSEVPLERMKRLEALVPVQVKKEIEEVKKLMRLSSEELAAFISQDPEARMHEETVNAWLEGKSLPSNKDLAAIRDLRRKPAGKRLQSLRQLIGLSQDQLAPRVGLVRPTLNGYEQGDSPVPLEIMEKVEGEIIRYTGEPMKKRRVELGISHVEFSIALSEKLSRTISPEFLQQWEEAQSAVNFMEINQELLLAVEEVLAQETLAQARFVREEIMGISLLRLEAQIGIAGGTIGSIERLGTLHGHEDFFQKLYGAAKWRFAEKLKDERNFEDQAQFGFRLNRTNPIPAIWIQHVEVHQAPANEFGTVMRAFRLMTVRKAEKARETAGANSPETRQELRQTVLALAQEAAVEAEVAWQLSQRARFDFDQMLIDLQAEAENPNVVGVYQAHRLGHDAEAFMLTHSDYDLAYENFITQETDNQRAGYEEFLKNNPNESLHFAFVFPLARGNRQALHAMRLQLRMISDLKSSLDFSGRVKSSIRLFVSSSDLQDAEVKALINEAVQKGLAFPIVADEAGAALKLQEFLNENPNGLIYGLSEIGFEALADGIKLQDQFRILRSNLSLEGIFPVTLGLTENVAKVSRIASSAELLRQAPDQIRAVLQAKGDSLFITSRALDLIYQAIAAESTIKSAA